MSDFGTGPCPKSELMKWGISHQAATKSNWMWSSSVVTPWRKSSIGVQSHRLTFPNTPSWELLKTLNASSARFLQKHFVHFVEMPVSPFCGTYPFLAVSILLFVDGIAYALV